MAFCEGDRCLAYSRVVIILVPRASNPFGQLKDCLKRPGSPGDEDGVVIR